MRHLFSSFGLPLLSYTVATPPDLRRDEIQTHIYTRNYIFLVGGPCVGQSGQIAGDVMGVVGSPGRDRGPVLAAVAAGVGVGEAYNKVEFIRFLSLMLSYQFSPLGSFSYNVDTNCS